MDILTHTLTGVCAGGAVASLTQKSPWKRALIVGWGAVGAVLPDMDTITLWSQFDTVIGSPLNLSMRGAEIYFGNYWYSHHNWTHSLFAAVLAAGLMGLASYLFRRLAPTAPSIKNFLGSHIGYFGALFAGYLMHLLGDLPTPGHIWHGIKLFWPLETPVGGTGHLWWWNNYDIFLLVASGALAILSALILNHLLQRSWLKYLPLTFFIITVLSAAHQIAHRPVRFTESAFAKNERQSLAIQKAILGNRVYRIMVSMDRQVAIHF